MLDSTGGTTAADATADAAHDLDAVVRRSCPWAFVVAPRVLRRVVQFDAEERNATVGSFRLDSFTVERRKLVQAVSADELGLSSLDDLPALVVLVARPSTGWFSRPDPVAERRTCERALFRERVHVELGERDTAAAFRRIDRIGRVSFFEATSVLERERRLRRPDDPWSCYADFAATLLELRAFEPALVPAWFPSLHDVDGVEGLLRAEVPSRRVREETRLPPPESSAPGEPRRVPTVPSAAPIGERAARRLMARARRLARRGNHVLAALTSLRACVQGPADRTPEHRAEHEEILARFADRLATSLDPESRVAANWEGLAPLVVDAARGFWTPADRLLYDLQRACEDAEQTVYEARPFTWLASFGRKPLWKPLPLRSYASALRHLRRALGRLTRCAIDEEVRAQLEHALDGLVADVERRMRSACRPVVREAFDRGGMRPANRPERVARDRLVEEYLDLVVDRGFATLPLLRDATARNQLKLADVKGLRDATSNDPLLRTDAELAANLDGLHRRGEVYLRWLQTFGSLAYGTRFGRRLLLHLVVPFGGSLLILEGLQHVVVEPAAVLFEPIHGLHLASPVAIVVLGAFLHVLIHRPRIRRRLWHALRRAATTAWRLPGVLTRWLRKIPVFARRFAWSFLKPLLVMLAVGGLLRAMEIAPELSRWQLLVVYLLTVVVVNSRPARDVEEVVEGELLESWRTLLYGIVQIGRMVLEFFRAVLDALERVLYAVDAAFRKREGEGPIVAAGKLLLAPAWAAVSYLVRFAVNLFVEPQVNPIKHFPVVTVAHKLLLPTIPAFAAVFASGGYDRATSYATAGIVVAVIPGMFGFLVWELKENWRLYEANRSPTLRPAVIGGHGETMRRFLRWGIHSGTLPRAYKRLRKALRRGDARAERRARTRLHHAATEIARLVEREFLGYLREVGDGSPAAEWSVTVRAGAGVVHVDVRDRDRPDEILAVTIEERSGWLRVRLESPDRHASGGAAGADRFRTALGGLYALFGIDFVREQLEVLFDPERLDPEPTTAGLLVWRLPDHDEAALYDLTGGSPVAPHTVRGRLRRELPRLDERQLLLSRSDVFWSDWLEAWESRADDAPAILPHLRLLPGTEEPVALP